MSSVILVTGAAGFAGSHLLDLLAHDGADLVAWRRPDGAPPHEISGTRWEPVDLLDRAAVAQAIARLRPEYRACIMLRHVEGYSYEEIAETLELPLGTVKTYIHRARNELRGYLEDRRE